MVLYVVNGVEIPHADVISRVTAALGAYELQAFQDKASMICYVTDPDEVGVVFYLAQPDDYPGLADVQYLARRGYRVIVIGRSAEMIYGVWSGLAGARAYIPAGYLSGKLVMEAIEHTFQTEATPTPA